jgi:hypothetical protein
MIIRLPGKPNRGDCVLMQTKVSDKIDHIALLSHQLFPKNQTRRETGTNKAKHVCLAFFCCEYSQRTHSSDIPLTY